MKKIVVLDKCVSCGSCTLESNLLIELPNGKVVGKEGVELSDKEEKDILEISKSCPVGAISIVEDNLVKANGEAGLIELIDLIHNENKNLKNKLINKNDYTFNKDEYKVPISNGIGGYRYEYKSDDKAMEEGLKDFDKAMYSQRKALIQQVLVEFKHRKLKKYYNYEEKEGNYYYDTNKKIKKVLERFIQEAERLSNNTISIPKETRNFDVKPDVQVDGFCSYILGIIEETYFTENILKELEFLRWYYLYVDTDDMEDYRGKYMYCYKDIYKVCELFAGHILDEVDYVVNGYDGVEKIIKETVDPYWNKVEKELTQKINLLEKKIIASKNGYNKDGFDAYGFNRNGTKYNDLGYDIKGLDKDGYNTKGFNEKGYYKNGNKYDELGYDIKGYDKDGYDFKKYNKFGFNKEGYHLTGTKYDQRGYDKDGYNEDDFNEKGYYRNGTRYGELGYDIKGYAKDGYDKDGYDKDYYDKNGYDIYGYNIKGYNKEGYNKNGYDKEEKNRFGEYYKPTYDKYGYDEKGFNQQGFNKEKIHKNGTKYNDLGYNFFGYDKEGFNANGRDIWGNRRLAFDKKENLENKESYDKNGFNKKGYHKNGSLYDDNGYNKEGFNRNAVDQYGYNKEGYNKKGYNIQGYNKLGYNKEGFNNKGYHKNGTQYNSFGYDVEGYNKDGKNRWGEYKK